VLQVQSPSRAFAYLGEMSAEGYAQGFGQQSNRIAGTVSDGISAPTAVKNAVAGNTNTINLTVEVYAQANQPEQLGAEVAQHVRSALIDLLEGAQPERGET
jgi:hypothetical protein